MENVFLMGFFAGALVTALGVLGAIYLISRQPKD